MTKISVVCAAGVDAETNRAVSEFCRRIPYAIQLRSPILIEVVPIQFYIADIGPTGACAVQDNRVICSGEARLLSSLEFGVTPAKIRVAATKALPNATGITLDAIGHALVHYEQSRDGRDISRRGVRLRCNGIRKAVARVHFCKSCNCVVRCSPTVHADTPFCHACCIR